MEKTALANVYVMQGEKRGSTSENFLQVKLTNVQVVT